jgi:hypothetical protein
MSEDRTTLHRLLTEVPAVYAVLGEALVPGGGGGGDGMPRAPKDPLERPAPANLEVAEHRHKLLRGLRWWVDAVRDTPPPAGFIGPATFTEHLATLPPVGSSISGLCAMLLAHLHVMAPEDHAELRSNLEDWLHDAYAVTGHRSRPAKALQLPEGAEDSMVRVADAARILGVSVRTIQRRAARTEGLVRLGDVLGPVRTVTVVVAQ